MDFSGCVPAIMVALIVAPTQTRSLGLCFHVASACDVHASAGSEQPLDAFGALGRSQSTPCLSEWNCAFELACLCKGRTYVLTYV